MAVIINPTASTNGTGSLISPKNTWAGLTWTAGETYLQVEGTTHNGTIAPSSGGSAGSPITIGVCEAQTGNRVQGLGRAKVNAAGQNYGLSLSNGVNYVRVDSLEFVNAQQRGMARIITGNDPAADSFCEFAFCEVHDCINPGTVNNGISMYGKGNKILSCEIYDVGVDGIYANADDIEIAYNRIYRVDRDWTIGTGDCIQLDNTDNPNVHHNYLEKDTLEKQCTIVQNGAGGRFWCNRVVAPSYTSGGTSPVTAVYLGNTGMEIVANVIDGGRYGLWCDGASSRIFANIIRLYGSGVLAGIAIRANNLVVAQNAIIGEGFGYGMNHHTYTGVGVYNNIILGALYGLQTASSGVTENGNLFHQCGANHVDLSNAAKAMGASDVTANPQFLDPARPWLGLSGSSPCRGAGVFVQGARDRFNRRYVERNIGPWAVLAAA